LAITSSGLFAVCCAGPENPHLKEEVLDLALENLGQRLGTRFQ
jgi:hypothetical protein